MDIKIIACFFTLPETEYDTLEEILNTYDIGHYLIGFEKTPDAKQKEHFHFLFEGTDQIYNAFSKRIVEKYGLRGKGRGNKKYGRVLKDIRDYEKMCSYTVKEGNYRGNFPEEDIQKWYDESFSKSEKQATRDLILAKLAEHRYQGPNNLRAKAIQLSADIAHNYRPTRSGIDGLVLEHYSRTGQHQRCFELLYPREDTPDYYIYEHFNQSVADQVNALGEQDNLLKEQDIPIKDI
jgi:hypothetical protein